MPKWNDASERKLLLCIITFAELKTISWDKIAELMGNEVSSEGCRQHFSRLKKGIISASGDPATPKSKTLPSVSESGKSATPAKTSGKRKRGGKASIQEDDVEPDSAGDGSPKPKKLREAKAKLDTKASKSEDGSAAGVADKD